MTSASALSSPLLSTSLGSVPRNVVEPKQDEVLGGPLLSEEEAFRIGDRVQFREHGQSWSLGVVTNVDPLEVRLDNEGPHCRWDEVRKFQSLQTWTWFQYFTLLKKSEDFTMMLKIFFEFAMIVSQAVSILFAAHEIANKGHNVYACTILACFFCIPLVFIAENHTSISQESMIICYIKRILCIEAFGHARNAWNIFRTVHVYSRLSITEAEESARKVEALHDQNLKLQEAAIAQRYEGMLVTFVNVTILLIDRDLRLLRPCVVTALTTAFRYAKYDFGDQVLARFEVQSKDAYEIGDEVQYLQRKKHNQWWRTGLVTSVAPLSVDGHIPMAVKALDSSPFIVGTVAATSAKGFLVALRFSELLASIGAFVLAHVAIKDKYRLDVCPVILVLVLTFLAFVAGSSKYGTNTHHETGSLKEILAGLCAFPGPVLLPWDQAYICCCGNTYYFLRVVVMCTCGALTALCRTVIVNDSFLLTVALTIFGFTLAATILLAFAWAQSYPKLPPAVRDVLIPDIAKSRLTMPHRWELHEDLLHKAYGLYNDRGDALDQQPGRGSMIETTCHFPASSEEAMAVDCTTIECASGSLASEEAARAFAARLKECLDVRNISFQKADLKPSSLMIIVGELPKNAAIEKVNFYMNYDLMEDGGAAVGAFINKCARLRRADFRSTGLNASPEHCDAVVKWLKVMSKNCTLVFGKGMNVLARKWTPCLSDLAEVQEIDISKTHLGTVKAMTSFSYIIRAARNLTKVNLASNVITSKAFQHFVAQLPARLPLLQVSFEGNYRMLTDMKAVDALAKLLEKCPCLEHIDLSGAGSDEHPELHSRLREILNSHSHVSVKKREVDF
eukprot:TRINITY_DN33475_c0_g1_i1.p1 TRINITY_DN33475_c0_g1~~TRINITY_DN33475_c0_g1_i1.p1  ORF type:complete len:861 (+),score=120.02 TRINITY_DN33475_c0_g1_i1:51-2585(+)